MPDSVNPWQPNHPSSPSPPREASSSWLAQQRVSLAFTTYQAGKMFMVGLQPDGKLSVFERTFNRCMGLHASPDAQTLWMTSLYQLWRFENFVPRRRLKPPTATTVSTFPPSPTPPATSTSTTSTCAATARPSSSPPSSTASPPSAPSAASSRSGSRPSSPNSSPKDRCHLNGLAVDPNTNEPAYVTMVSRSDVSDGWRDRRTNGGLLMDVRTNEVVCENLSMPHSPRIHPDHPGKVWLLNAGTGFFGYIDVSAGDNAFHEVAFCPGFLRGMTFVGDKAIVGLSASRKNRNLPGPPPRRQLKQPRRRTPLRPPRHRPHHRRHRRLAPHRRHRQRTLRRGRVAQRGTSEAAWFQDG